MAKAARIIYHADGDYVDKEAREFKLTQEVIEKIDSVEPSAERNSIQGIKVNGELQTPDQYRVVSLAIPEVEDNLDSISATNALSAKQGRFLYNRIKNLEGLGKFLSNWDATLGLPTTNPQAIPYEYHSGDYYIVGRVGATNYRPDGTSYRGLPSVVEEEEEVKVGDFYFYNGSIWELLLNTDRQIPIDESLSTSSTNPVENRVVTAAINLKANDADISIVGKTNDFNDLDNQPFIPTGLDELTGTADDITEGNNHLFLTSTERTKLVNTTNTNTGDETQASIMTKLGAASTNTNGYLTAGDWNTFNNKQNAIADLSDIRDNAAAGKNASDEIATYGDIVTHDVNEFATAAQGGKADTALQPLDNVSELTNDAGYITSAYHDNTKQDVLTAGTNIQINGSTISATDTTYQAGDFDIKDLADSTNKRASWDAKQNALTPGSNIQINGNTISATDTTYTAGPGISISNNNVISAADNKAVWGSIEGTLGDQTDLQSALDDKQNKLTAGTNIQISGNTISATDTTYTAGNGISISAGNVISNTQTSAEWGNIQGDIEDQGDLQTQFATKQDKLLPGNNVSIAADGKTISATDTTYVAGDFDIKDLADSTNLRSTWNAKQDAISDLATIRSNASTAIQPLDNVSELTNDAGYITASAIPTLDVEMSDSSTAGVQNKVIKQYVDSNIASATAGAVSDTAYASSWNGITGIAPSKNAVYDKLSAMDTTIAGKQATISDLASIRTGAGKGATAVQPNDNISTLTNDAGYITKSVNNLDNYYTKSDTYTKAEVASYVANFTGFKTVSTLPTTDIQSTIIYLLGPFTSVTGADKYEEYIYSNNAWVKIGETSVDLSNYFNTSTQTSDAITEGSQNLFLTSTERTKLLNTTNTNSGDETKSSIQTKLGAASASNNGYLTSTAYTTFSNKQDAIADLSDIRDNATAGKGAATTIAGYGDIVTRNASEFLTTSKISDTAYAATWNGVTDVAPSKNAVYDKLNAMDTTIAGKANSSHTHTIANVTNLQSSLDAKLTTPSGGSAGQVLTKTASGYSWTTPETGGNVVAMTQAEYNALTSEEKADGKLRIISDAPSVTVGNISSDSVSTIVVSSEEPASGTADSVITFVV